MESLEPSHWLLIVFGLLILVSIIRRVLNPPKVVSWAEVPEAIREAAGSALPGFAAESTRHDPHMGKYVMSGSYRGNQGRLEVECNRRGEISEIEFESLGNRSGIFSGESCGISEVPPIVLEHVHGLLGTEASQLQTHRISTGKINGEPVFKVKGRTPNWKWEFEILADGRLIEMEKEKPRV